MGSQGGTTFFPYGFEEILPGGGLTISPLHLGRARDYFLVKSPEDSKEI